MLYLHVYLRKGFRLLRSNGQAVVVASTRRYTKEVFIDRLVESITGQPWQFGVFDRTTPVDVAVVFYDAAPLRGANVPGLTIELMIPDTMADPVLGSASIAISDHLINTMAEALAPDDIQLPNPSELSVRVYVDFQER